MPELEQTIAGIAEDVGRGDQPQPEHDFCYLLPTLQSHILKLGETEHHDADRKRIQDHYAAVRVDKLMAVLGRKPWRQRDEHAKQHATPVFPCSMSGKKTKVRHCKPPLERGIRQRLAKHDTTKVRDNKARSRFELDVDGGVAFANYRLTPSTVIITHTETPRALRGHGVASELVQGALQLIRADGLKVIAGCGFVVDYLHRHPEFADL